MQDINHTKRIEDLIQNNHIFVFIKGTPDKPMCGFTAQVIKILKDLEVPFKSFNVLEDPEMRQAIKDYTDWQTIPQIFIDGNFIGGSDILQELLESGELQEMVKK